MILRSPVTLPLLAFGTPKPVPPDPRAHDTFRVTQRFDDPDFFFRDGRLHRALDIGNFRCGDPVVASAAGTVRRGTDQYGGRFIIIDHSGGWQTAYWHLNDWSVPHGAAVKRGQQIGIVGRTGAGNVCHLHLEARRNGVHVDPWPLLEQNQEDDVRIKGTFRRHIVNRRTSVANAGRGGNLRAGPTTSDEIVIPASVARDGTAFVPIAEVEGDVVAGDSRWYAGINHATPGGWSLLYAHHSILGPLAVSEQSDCSQAVANATLALNNKLAGVRTAATGAAQAIEAVRKAAE